MGHTTETRFGEDHYFKALLGYNYEQSVFNAVNTERNGLVYSDATNINLAEGPNITTAGGYDKWAILGGFGRLNYSFRDRYLVEFDGRYDGSSKFPSNQRYAFFPSGSAGWRISKEDFWHLSPSRICIGPEDQGVPMGALGNGSVASYLYQQNFNIQESAPFILQGIRPQGDESAECVAERVDLKEKAVTADLGLDASFSVQPVEFHRRRLCSA